MVMEGERSLTTIADGILLLRKDHHLESVRNGIGLEANEYELA